ncbi:hypothetical protein DFH08DRAFT_967082 [Mycena albidolilacea]|uniref:Fucose-specific lectin n=1 Tax=Mycena albidolilacea TaxID=1033008 RepID=A0AAD6ZN15_9AGAR|nr:hypothetical protein DFH08DRAFT_967082 [Mycena albidolilacea]
MGGVLDSLLETLDAWSLAPNLRRLWIEYRDTGFDDIFDRAGLAAFPLQIKSTGNPEEEQIRVYFVNDDGKLYEFAWLGPREWRRGNNGDPIASDVRRGTPLASVIGGVNGVETYVFYLDTDSNLRAVVGNGGGWTVGARLPVTDMADDTSLAAVTRGKRNDTIRVYYQQTSGDLKLLWFSDGGWFASGGRVLTDPRRGTKLAYVNAIERWSGNNDYSFHLFYIAEWKTSYKIIHQSDILGSDIDQKVLSPDVRPDTGLAVVAWRGSGAGEYNLRLYFADPDGEVLEYGYSSAKGWDQKATKPSGTTSSMSKPLAAVTFSDDKGQNVQVLVKDGSAALVEMFATAVATMEKWDKPEVVNWNGLKD